MRELWEQALQLYNLPLTVGLVICCAYWIISSIGIFDFDSDIDIDADADVNLNGGIFGLILNFVNAADVPIMLVLTLLNTSMWVMSMISNELWNPEGSLGTAGILFALNFIFSVLAVKFLTKPIAPLFHAIKNDVEAAVPLVGQSGIIKSRVLDHHYGQVEVYRNKTAPALVNCRLSETDSAMVRGEEVLIIRYDKPTKKYVAVSLATNEESPKLIEQSNIETETLTE